MMSKKMQQEEEEGSVLDAFNEWDESGKGMIKVDEFKSMLKKLREVRLTNSDVEQMVAVLDPAKKGEFKFEGICHGFAFQHCNRCGRKKRDICIEIYDELFSRCLSSAFYRKRNVFVAITLFPWRSKSLYIVCFHSSIFVSHSLTCIKIFASHSLTCILLFPFRLREQNGSSVARSSNTSTNQETL